MTAGWTRRLSGSLYELERGRDHSRRQRTYGEHEKGKPWVTEKVPDGAAGDRAEHG